MTIGILELRSEYSINERVNHTGEERCVRRDQVDIVRHPVGARDQDFDEFGDGEWGHEEEEENDHHQETGQRFLDADMGAVIGRRGCLLGVYDRPFHVSTGPVIQRHQGYSWHSKTYSERQDDIDYWALSTLPVYRTSHLPVVIVYPSECYRNDRENKPLYPGVTDDEADSSRCHDLLIPEGVTNGNIAISGDEHQRCHGNDDEAVVCGTREVTPDRSDPTDIKYEGEES